MRGLFHKSGTNDLVIALNPFSTTSPRMTAAAARAGALGVLDLGTGGRAARSALDRTARWTNGAFGVRITAGCALTAADLPEQVSTVVLAVGATARPEDFPDVRVLVEVTDRGQAHEAVLGGAHGVIARGHESGGRVGDLATFVLLQQLLADLDAPVWAAGGIGPNTAAAAVAGGAAGVVLDVQLALLAESELPADVAGAIAAMDGSETTVVHGHRVLLRKGLGAAVAPDLEALTGPLDARFPPVGQDGFLAAVFRDRWGTVGAAVRGVRDAVTHALTGPAVDALGPDSPGARAMGTSLPIAQGPMTRVSDQPAFAEAVALGGGLPFIALALSTGPQTREVLTTTRERLGDSPWGVGVLGFAAEDVKSAQLDVIRELRPTHAIIAGGRPAQAAALDAVGITTFLHVPSPGLLRQFLAAGARRFVFEGAECGGHVGPRNSFPLWEAQLAVLAEWADSGFPADDVHVLFAGGIHDERSAAMVAALATPLTDRGGAIGVLMGTAYLFTEEAVRAGAVQPLFQRQVVAAESTALLETAPGHATRCVTSPFTDEYAAVKQGLRDREVPDREAWEQLERLNVGRLRVASKGIERIGDVLSEVDEGRQLGEGMFMAGDVAVLRSEVTTIAALHASVTTGAASFAAERAVGLGLAPAESTAPVVAPLDIAVIGMACMFPQAPDLPAFWANVLSGVDAVTEVPAVRWDPAVYYAPDGDGDRTPSRWGGFLPQIPFDPLGYGIPPTSLASIEPVQLLALEAASRALADAGYAERPFDRSRTSVVFGAEAGSDLSNAMTLRTVLPSYFGDVPAGLRDQLPTLTEDSFPGVLANVIAGRIANRLDLGGANYTVDAACASSLTAVDVACKELTGGTSDVVLCGGADLHNGINDYLLFSSVHALSPTGRCATFDSSADGIALGEGVACVVLKRLADAERDGDRVYAVIKGVGSASDGRSLGLTAPRPEGQRNALERAYRNAGISPAEVGLVEAHGTGTVVGDRTELGTLTDVFVEAGAAPASCAVGSVKSQIGHTKCAAGLAGLIKASLALHTGVQPPTLHVSRPNSAWVADTSPFTFHDGPRPWAAEPADRVAGVSAFGFGGTNFHVVLRGYDGAPPPAHGLDEWPAELFTFRGEGAVRAAEQLLELVEAGGWRLRDYALSAAKRADLTRGEVRIAVVASDVDDLAAKLRRAVAGEDKPADGIFRATGVAGEVAFLFPGQGSQRPGMFAELFVAFPELQRHVQVGAKWADVLHPPTAFDAAERAAQQAGITDTRVAQPVLGIVGLAAFDLFAAAGVHPDMVAGHSYGELVALAAAGALPAESLPALSAARAEAILAATGDDPGAMAAVTAPAAAFAELLPESVVVANHNSPVQTVISGPTGDVEAAVVALEAAGFRAKRIRVACAFHSPLVASAGAAFAAALGDVRAPEIPVWSNRTAAEYGDDIPAELAAQLGSPVRFAEQVEAMYAHGARVFVEAGPGSVLSGLVSAILGDRPHRTVGLESYGQHGVRGFLTALAQLAVSGVDPSTSWLHRGRDSADASVPRKTRAAGWTVDGHLVRTAAGAIPSGALRPAERVQEIPMAVQGGGGSDEALIAEFLRGSREMIAAQRDVLLNYLGTGERVPVQRVASPQPVLQQVVVQPVVIEQATIEVVAAPNVMQTVLEIIAERTGYPIDMIEADLDLEADLSVDSIKRTEIAGELAARLGVTADLETLSQARTAAAIAALLGAGTPVIAIAVPPPNVLRTVLDIIAERTGYPTDMIEPDLDLEADLSVDSIKRTEIAGELLLRLGVTADLEQLSQARTAAAITALLGGGAPAATVAIAPVESAEAVVIAPHRLVMTEFALPAATAPESLAGKRFLVVGDGEDLVAGLVDLGAEVTRDVAAVVDGVFHLDRATELPDAFPLFRSLLANAPRWLIAAGAGEGLRGFTRSAAREYPDIAVKVLENPSVDTLLAELGATDGEPVVRITDAGRVGLRMVETDLGPLGSSGAGPAGDGAAEAAAIGLDRDSVVLLVGGAKGITARFAATLAGASRCTLELFGRTALPTEEEPAAIAAAADPAALRAALIASGLRSPAEIEREIGRVEAVREVRDTIARLTGLGSRVRYHSVDMRDVEAVHRAVKEVHTEHGRLDGLVYAAGVIEDKLIAEKSAESFGRVYGTKVDGAKTLLDAVEGMSDGPRFAVFFGSIAAALGNRGQADYAAANDALESLGRGVDFRGLTVHWGPWAPTGTNNGMVTPELMRSYAKRGIKLIDPEEGALSLLRELAWGPDGVDSVVYTASGW
ncbi:SDR family NAD(P)-dependent oxidoreductase [Umezawaea sp. Da 62-37]|uniref:SDR family NAD(P)-dependent oxidoreductase n=1 Tax=Umezawaea sp. Da 62-37 TaxID=3075927 RepID=UPI0028F6DF6C|nr:SDR family NAD(P)-dependent oxidoreductase [Umezawaea sp. Da 62-37]WNV89264.1 SDR family NAD(P)-dependent oxidoreductase [Umezawaea sp. Da 62-37]